MASSFENAIETVLKHEGGFSNHPSDPGGATNYGVSIRWLRTLGNTDGDGCLEGDLDHDGDVDIDDIKKMSRSDAENLYRTQWWDRYGYGAINDQRLATKVFDMAVNMGAGRAHTLLQEALWRVDKPVLVDGKLGPKTIATVNSVKPVESFYMVVQNTQASFYNRLHQKNPAKFGAFIRGWLNRAYDR